MINAFDLKNYIDIKGYVSDDEKIHNLINSDIFVFPTYYPEGCPTVVIEALAAGLFVITTDTAALKEIIQDGINGKIVKKNDYMDLKSNLEWCLNNKEEVITLGINNKKYAFENFESKKIIDNFYFDYIKLIND
jgi:glycosyltransferase involved in cell wall biosynthesis